MAVARLGGGNSFAIYWLKLVTLGIISFLWKFRLISMDPMLTYSLLLYGLCSFMSVLEQGDKLFILKVRPVCTYTF